MFKKFLILFTLILLGCYAEITPNHNNTEKFLIAGGYTPKVHTFAKYAVSIAKIDNIDLSQYGKGHICGGIIIGLQTILTAAHCIYKYKAKPHELVVIAGTPVRKKIDQSTQILFIEKIIIHPQYKDEKTSPHDIGILHLRNKVIEDKKTVKHVELPSKEYAKAGESCVLIGWGRLGDKGPLADEIRYVNLYALEKKECDKKLFPIDKTFCAVGIYNEALGGCLGDAGGPAFCQDKLSGINTISISCSKSEPTYFTDIYKYLDWIKENTLHMSGYRSSARIRIDGSIYVKISSAISFVIMYIFV